ASGWVSSVYSPTVREPLIGPRQSAARKSRLPPSCPASRTGCAVHRARRARDAEQIRNRPAEVRLTGGNRVRILAERHPRRLPRGARAGVSGGVPSRGEHLRRLLMSPNVLR